MKELEINLTDEELEELRAGKEFHWCFEGVPVHLFKGEEE
jgi:hypothetical protein